ncbi:MAG: transposase [Candidatus Korobacteraceae bacterium]
MSGIDVEALLGAGYAIFLTVVAAALELLARHSHQRTQRVRTVGFTYQSDLDIWKCPNGKHLYRAEVIRESTVVRYRALAHQCNSCPIKNRCTDSDEGRVIEVQRDSWLESELRNFHRGLSLTLLLLADLILVVTILRQNDTRSQLLLALPLLCITGAGLRLTPQFFRPARKRAWTNASTSSPRGAVAIGFTDSRE